MVTKQLEILETGIEYNVETRDKIRITITDTSGERQFVTTKVRPTYLRSHESYAERVKRVVANHKGFE